MRLKQAERIAEQIFYKIANGVQFNIFDLSKVSKPAESVLLAGGTVEAATEAMQAAVQIYRLN
jgi:hypothetical protein